MLLRNLGTTKMDPKTNAFPMQISDLSPAFCQLVYEQRLWNLSKIFFSNFLTKVDFL